jgi:hypothetical protein
VVCSACGFENPGDMRFCGMCGVPLPQRPITTPGAQSTLTFTRVPVETRSAVSDKKDAPVSGRSTAAVVEAPRVSSPEPNPTAAELPLREPVRAFTAPTVEPPAKELVPDVPLDDYVKKFRYEPPKDPTEVTMRGDAQVAVPESPEESAASGKAKLTTSTQADKPSISGKVKSPLPTSDDVDRRLGLEPESPAEATIARPRFLEINQLPKEVQPEGLATSTISGPSFLGLNNAPQNWSDAVGVEPGDYAPRSTHWRAWLAVAVVLVIGGLAFLEWRAQRYQTDNGPVEVIRASIRNLRRGTPPQNANEQAPVTPPAGADPNAKPEMQVQEQPKPQSQPEDQSATSNSAASTTPQGNAAQPNTATPASAADSQARAQSSTANTPASSQNATSKQSAPPATSVSTPRQKPAAAAAGSSQSVASQQTPPTPKAKRQLNTGDDDKAVAKSAVPGAEEMTKAKNASDSAAAAAWLWKSTAKGNPDAPVQLADMYIAGDGVPHSCEQALVLLKTAAEKENARARNRLASLYSTGTCVQRNRVEAYRWLSSSLTADPNNQWAQQNRDLLWQQMNPGERAAAEKYR